MSFPPATALLPIFQSFHASAYLYFVHQIFNAMLTKQTCIFFAMMAAMLLISLKKMPVFESIRKTRFLNFVLSRSMDP